MDEKQLKKAIKSWKAAITDLKVHRELIKLGRLAKEIDEEESKGDIKQKADKTWKVLADGLREIKEKINTSSNKIIAEIDQLIEEIEK